MKKLLAIILILAVSLIVSDTLFAQCAMCKATIEANQANAGKYGVGLNTGILYLMVVPYIAFGVLGFFWYKNAKAKRNLNSLRSQTPS